MAAEQANNNSPSGGIDAAEVDTLVRAACAAAVPYPAQAASSPQKLDAASAAIAEGVLKRLVAGGGAGTAAAAAAANKGDGTSRSTTAPAPPQPRYKFVVSVHLSQVSGAGLHVAAAHRLDPRTDGRVVVAWQGAAEGRGGGANGGGADTGNNNNNDAATTTTPPVVLDALVTVFYVAI